jgi:hypothetical protein
VDRYDIDVNKIWLKFDYPVRFFGRTLELRVKGADTATAYIEVLPNEFNYYENLYFDKWYGRIDFRKSDGEFLTTEQLLLPETEYEIFVPEGSTMDVFGNYPEQQVLTGTSLKTNAKPIVVLNPNVFSTTLDSGKIDIGEFLKVDLRFDPGVFRKQKSEILLIDVSTNEVAYSHTIYPTSSRSTYHSNIIPTDQLIVGKTYKIQFPEGVYQDQYGNSWNGKLDDIGDVFTIQTCDTEGMELYSFSMPAQNVEIGDFRASIFFTKPIRVNVAKKLYLVDQSGIVEDSSNVIFSNSIYNNSSINFEFENLKAGKTYKIEFEEGLVIDMCGNDLAQKAKETYLSIVTEANQTRALSLSGFSLQDDEIIPNQFNGYIGFYTADPQVFTKEGSSFEIYRKSDSEDELVLSYPISGGRYFEYYYMREDYYISFYLEGLSLEPSSDYYITTKGFITDRFGNVSEGVTDKERFIFTTGDLDPLYFKGANLGGWSMEDTIRNAPLNGFSLFFYYSHEGVTSIGDSLFVYEDKTDKLVWSQSAYNYLEQGQDHAILHVDVPSLKPSTVYRAETNADFFTSLYDATMSSMGQAIFITRDSLQTEISPIKMNVNLRVDQNYPIYLKKISFYIDDYDYLYHRRTEINEGWMSIYQYDNDSLIYKTRVEYYHGLNYTGRADFEFDENIKLDYATNYYVTFEQGAFLVGSTAEMVAVTKRDEVTFRTVTKSREDELLVKINPVRFTERTHLYPSIIDLRGNEIVLYLTSNTDITLNRGSIAIRTQAGDTVEYYERNPYVRYYDFYDEYVDYLPVSNLVPGETYHISISDGFLISREGRLSAAVEDTATLVFVWQEQIPENLMYEVRHSSANSYYGQNSFSISRDYIDLKWNYPIDSIADGLVLKPLGGGKNIEIRPQIDAKIRTTTYLGLVNPEDIDKNKYYQLFIPEGSVFAVDIVNAYTSPVFFKPNYAYYVNGNALFASTGLFHFDGGVFQDKPITEPLPLGSQIAGYLDFDDLLKVNGQAKLYESGNESPQTIDIQPAYGGSEEGGEYNEGFTLDLRSAMLMPGKSYQIKIDSGVLVTPGGKTLAIADRNLSVTMESIDCHTEVKVSSRNALFVEDGSGAALYTDNQLCSWLIVKDSLGTIEFEMHAMDVERRGDYLSIANVATGELLFDSKNHSTLSKVHGDSLMVIFKTDDYTEKQGWNFSAKMIGVNYPVAPSMISLSNNEFTIAENNQEVVLSAIEVFDENYDEVYTYEILGEGAGDFKVENGNLIANANLDFETKANYQLQLMVTDKDGLTVTKDFTVVVTDVDETQVGVIDHLTNVSAYPNPFKDYLKVANASNEPIVVSIVDLKGVELMKQEISSGSGILSTKKLSSGLYLLVIKQGENQKAERFIKE